MSKSGGSRFIGFFILSLILLGLYIVYTGAISITELILGLISAFIVSYIFSREWIQDTGKLTLKRLAMLLAYFVKYFTIIEAKAHWSVVKAILSPNMNIKPAIVRVPHSLETDFGIVTVANSITNTPGTVTLEVDDEGKALFVHWLFAETTEDEEAREKISKEFEEWAKLIFER